ncbi:MAG TPA: hypothetical protein VK438_13515 [Xanthobacteraceae bacterium]|nr:hypothetical protein [Xanthobacteraceae bacterium]
MSEPPRPPEPVKAPAWRRVLAGILDFLTVFFAGGFVIGKLTGRLTDDGFKLTGAPALALFAVIAIYFYLGWKRLGGTIWQRILGARPAV